MKRALDLFCCGGGASRGLADAGFEVTGVDIEPQPEYPYKFIQYDALKLGREMLRCYDFIWASPKCQRYLWSTTTKVKESHPDQIPPTREMLDAAGVPYCIENVERAPLRQDLLLCGEMFKLGVRRHRIFEISGFTARQPHHPKHKKASDVPISVLQNKPHGLITEPIPISKYKHSQYACVAGHGGDGFSFRIEDWQRAMEIYWISNRETLTQAIPPKYSHYIAMEFLK